MTPLVTHRSWQLADLSRTVDDGMLIFECKRMQLSADCIPDDETQLRADLELVLRALLKLVRGDHDDVIVDVSPERQVLVSNSIADELNSHLGEERVKALLEELADSIGSAESLTDEQVDLFDQLAKAADVEATASMRPLMRR